MTIRNLLLLALTCAPLAAQQAGAGTPALRAAVLEHADRWTDQATGAAWLLGEAGFATQPLTPTSLTQVDLVVFGSFTNNGPEFGAFVDAHTDALRGFVAAGGVVLELAQSDQFGARASYLPEGCDVRRGDADDDALRVALPDHTLAQQDWLRREPPGFATWNGHAASWEGIERHVGGQVVLAAGSRAALVEVAHGKGRFLVSSLWLDKLRGPDGALREPVEQREAAVEFGRALARYVVRVRRGEEPPVAATTAPIEMAVGPVLGHVDENSARVWMRPAQPGSYQLRILGGRRTDHADVPGLATAENDRCVVWHVPDLRPGTDYRYEVLHDDEVLHDGPDCRFRTAPPANSPSRVRLAFASCAAAEPASAWSAMQLRGIDGLVLLGDTPYIDTTDLDAAREKHRRFLEVPELAALLRSTPLWATWDDHDFGRNDSDGRLPGKANTRRAFVDYRALAGYGDGENGIYTSFRRGPLEVFLLDTRWFSRTEPTAPDDDRPALLGAAQWRWLESGLRASTAPFKLIACGMIWDDKENSESDDWGSYPYERERLEGFLGAHDISGAVLMGGDIHVSRHLRYPDSALRVGYVLDQLIVSPLHDGVIESLDVPHPALLWSVRLPRVFLTLSAEDTGEGDPVLTARWVHDIGRGAGEELRRVAWRASELRR